MPVSPVCKTCDGGSLVLIDRHRHGTLAAVLGALLLLLGALLRRMQSLLVCTQCGAATQAVSRSLIEDATGKASPPAPLVVLTLLPLLGLVSGCHSDPVEPAPTVAPASAVDPASASTPVDRLIALRWDGDRKVVIRTYGGKVVDGDDELVSALESASRAPGATSAGEFIVTIDAEGPVPWKYVVGVINACQRAGIHKVEYAFGQGAR